MSSTNSNPGKLKNATTPPNCIPATPCCTPVHLDRQARNKDPLTGQTNHWSPEEEYDNPRRRKPVEVKTADDAYESAERRTWAATILDSPELIMMHALSRDDSVPSTRQHFTALLCGFDKPRRSAAPKSASTPKSSSSPRNRYSWARHRERELREKEKEREKAERDMERERRKVVLSERNYVPYTEAYEM